MDSFNFNVLLTKYATKNIGRNILYDEINIDELSKEYKRVNRKVRKIYFYHLI